MTARRRAAAGKPAGRTDPPGTLTLVLRLRLGGEIAMGPGKADLLEAIHETRSISAAARSLRMSYRRAWLLVDAMNRCFAKPLVVTATGGARGGGARVSPLGRQVARRFRAMEARARASVERDGVRLRRVLLRSPVR